MQQTTLPIHSESPFEIHLTIKGIAAANLRGFLCFCKEIDAKPLSIELSRGEHLQQTMFSKTLRATDIDTVFQVSEEYRSLLIQRGYESTRLKIEIPLDISPAGHDDAKAGIGQYFEWHGKVSFIREDDLRQTCARHGAHLSINALKDERETRFVTLREMVSRATFLTRVLALVLDLTQGGWEVVREQFEYCVYDSNQLLDQGWLN